MYTFKKIKTLNEKVLFSNRLFDENLREVDKGIGKIYALFNGIFEDRKTAFIFTSDHGMSNKGTINYCFEGRLIYLRAIFFSLKKGGHGAGSPHETETPIIAWGAGLNHWKNIAYKPE